VLGPACEEHAVPPPCAQARVPPPRRCPTRLP
jgi:hypothetical protein